MLVCNNWRNSRWIVGKSPKIRTENLLWELSTTPKDTMIMTKKPVNKGLKHHLLLKPKDYAQNLAVNAETASVTSRSC